MRTATGVLVFLLAACSPGEEETFTASANVDMEKIPAMLGAIDAISDNALPVDELIELTNTTPMDQEQQLRFPVRFEGRDTEMLYHVWREQEDWVHVYASSTTKGLVDAVEASFTSFERASGP